MGKVKIIPEEDYDKFLDIIIDAYPGEFQNFTKDDRDKLKERFLTLKKESQDVYSYGLYREDNLLGVMRVFDFNMNFKLRKIKTWGIGLVAVDLTHKKEKIAKGLLSSYHDILRKNNVSVSVLYPFRADFYKQMGYGYGTKMNLYNFKPSSLPNKFSKDNVQYLKSEDITEMHKCYMQYVNKTHGMIDRTEIFFDRFFKNAKNRFAGYKTKDGIESYIIFHFNKAKEDNFIYNDIVISELIYNNPESLLALSTFLHSQADQINRIKFATQDANFHYILSDARNGTNNIFHTSQEISQTGRGLMYRIVDVRTFFDQVRGIKFGTQSLKLRLNIIDSFINENEGEYHLSVNKGLINVVESQDDDLIVEVDISYFSSLVMGCVTFNELEMYGLVKISDCKFISTVNEMFRVDKEPICMTYF